MLFQSLFLLVHIVCISRVHCSRYSAQIYSCMLDMSQDSVRQTSTDATGSADDGLAYMLLILNVRGLERRCLQLVRTWIVLQRVRLRTLLFNRASDLLANLICKHLDHVYSDASGFI